MCRRQGPRSAVFGVSVAHGGAAAHGVSVWIRQTVIIWQKKLNQGLGIPRSVARHDGITLPNVITSTFAPSLSDSACWNPPHNDAVPWPTQQDKQQDTLQVVLSRHKIPAAHAFTQPFQIPSLPYAVTLSLHPKILSPHYHVAAAQPRPPSRRVSTATLA
jgi:hypothetical protein